MHDLLLSCREQTRAVCARTCLEFAPSAEGEANQFVCLATDASVGCNVTLDEVRVRVSVRVSAKVGVRVRVRVRLTLTLTLTSVPGSRRSTSARSPRWRARACAARPRTTCSAGLTYPRCTPYPTPKLLTLTLTL